MGLDFLRKNRTVYTLHYDRCVESIQREFEDRAVRSQELISEAVAKNNGALANAIRVTPTKKLDKLELLITLTYQVRDQMAPPPSSKAAMPKTFVRLENWLGYVPSPSLRKQVGKMLADQQVYVQELRAQGQNRAARWQEFCTHLLWLLYVGKSVLRLGRELRGKARG